MASTPARILTPEGERNVLEFYRSGMSVSEISRQMKIGARRIARVCRSEMTPAETEKRRLQALARTRDRSAVLYGPSWALDEDWDA